MHISDRGYGNQDQPNKRKFRERRLAHGTPRVVTMTFTDILSSRASPCQDTTSYRQVLQDSEGNTYLHLAIFASSEGPQPSDQIEDLWEILLPDLPYQQAELEPGWHRIATPGPTWSPDSMRIAFSAKNEQGYEEVWVVGIDGSNLVNLTNGLDGDYPAWQPVPHPATATSVEAQSWGRIKSLHSTGSR